MKAADIMTTNVFMIDSLAAVADAIALMQDRKVRFSSVEPNEDGAYGTIAETNIVYKVATKDVDPESVMVDGVTTKPYIVVNLDLDLKNVTKLFAETGASRAPVIQEHLLGIISITDLLIKSNTSSQFAGGIFSKEIRAIAPA